jgi:hypothetical protein
MGRGVDIAWPPKGVRPRMHRPIARRDVRHIDAGFRIGSSWQQRRREDLQKHPWGEEEKEHFVPR